MVIYVVRNTDKIQCVCPSRELADKVIEEYDKYVSGFWERPTVEECHLIEKESDITIVPIYQHYYIVGENKKKCGEVQHLWGFNPDVKKYLTPLSIFFVSSMFDEKVLQVFCSNKEECEKEFNKKIEEILSGKLKPITEEEANKILNG